ncbi:MAG TPA: hypothetical protein EYM91_05180 [Acidobacteria bacterium]|nr:hypothetical protein [Acidobacteriota bacterium]
MAMFIKTRLTPMRPERLIRFTSVCLVVLGTACGGGEPGAPPDTSSATETPTAVPSFHILFQTDRDGGFEVYMMDANGANQTNLTNNAANRYNDRHPTSSPDGSAIAFRSDRDGNPDVWVMQVNGTNQQNLTNHPATDLDAAWSPNGSQIVFDSDRDGNMEIYVMNSDGSEPRRLTTNDALDSHPYWSPDGSWITFHSDRDGR